MFHSIPMAPADVLPNPGFPDIEQWPIRSVGLGARIALTFHTHWCKVIPAMKLPRSTYASSWLTLVSCALTLQLLCYPTTVTAQTDVVATVQGQPITAETLQTAMRGQLLQLDLERYEAMRIQLDAMVTSRLYDLEAVSRGLSRVELERVEIMEKLESVGPDKVRSFYDKNRDRMSQSFEVMEGRLTALLTQQAERNRREAFARELRERYDVRIYLKPPRVEVSADDDPYKGSVNAPVTLIEFSDFQCPYCRRVQSVLNRLMSTYEGKLKLVYRDFPLRRIHPEAQKAAEAAQCANEQGAFWPYHDRLFTTTDLGTEHLKRYAVELGLDDGPFNACLDSGKYYQEVQDDMDDAIAVGVNAAPSFFVNGLLINGAVSYERFVQMVELALDATESP